VRGKESGKIKIFTTRLDTVFGITYVVLAPEHRLIDELNFKIKNFKEIKKYRKKIEAKLEAEREKEKSGIKLEGILAENPFTKEKVPLFVSEYVLGNYATGAIMGVPAHDERDFEFAKQFKLKIKKVIEGGQKKGECYEGKGILVNSGEFSGLHSDQAKEKMIEWLEKRKIGGRAVYYKIRDWVFARQRYWGEPFPLVFCENCKKKILEKKYKKGEFNQGELLNPGWIALSEKDLPVKLPKVKYYQPTGTGESPLANIKKWVKTKCPKCNSPAKRETNTMPQWAGSCWYYLRYLDPKNERELVDKKKEKYWMPVDLYVGGIEHATRHLIYARFWYKFLSEIKVVFAKEPFLRLKSVGIILGPDSRKMSKRYGNVINPEEICKKYGADALRIYELFMGPFDQKIAWQERGIVGMRRFLEKVWNLQFKVKKEKSKRKNLNLLRILHKTIKKVSEDIENFRFNTAISQLMIFVNEAEKEEKIEKEIFENFIKILAPFAPHLAEEIWENLGQKKLIFSASWPKYDKNLIKEEKITFIIQINGKVRDKIEVEVTDISEKKIKEIALSRKKIKERISGKKIKKIIFIPEKLINFVL